MLKNEINIFFERYPSPSELSSSDADLLAAARDSVSSAYAPYSNFQVGAAAILAGGTIVQGSNQENAAFSQSVCAEQNVLSTIGASYPEDEIVSLAVTALHKTASLHQPIFPCGSCRQILAEFRRRQGSPIRLILQGPVGDVLVFEDALDLLPFAFSGEMLRHGL